MRLYMAPLQSYTTAFYRKAHAITYGKMDKYFTPFFEVENKDLSVIINHSELSEFLNEGLNVVPQVACKDGSFLINFAKSVKDRGFDEINLNAGCPFPMLVKRQKGGGLLSSPDLMKKILDDYFSVSTDVKLSIKMRLGQTNYSEGEVLMQMLNEYPIEELIVHPRLVTQKYSGEVDWLQFEHLRTLSRHQLIANGDINSVNDAENLKKRFPDCIGLMLGRGLLSQPSFHQNIIGNNNHSNQLLELHQHYFELITSHYIDWNQAFNYLITFWHYPLQQSQTLKRHYRRLKKHNKADSYQIWLKELQAIYAGL